MDNAEAREVLAQHLAHYRTLPYDELVCLARPRFFWDHREGGAIRVLGTVDDGGWRAFRPLTEDFIVEQWRMG